MNFSSVLKILRTEKGLSQRDLAKFLNLSHSAIGLYETGDREPNFETLKKFATFFGTTTDYLLGKTNNRYPSSEETPEKIADMLNFIRESSKKMTADECNQLSRAVKAFVRSVKEDEKK
jgi:transcriptional regulator with XRE-family HTH domain